MIDLDRRDRVRRWMRRADLTYRGVESQEIEIGRWVVVTDQFRSGAPVLSKITDGPIRVCGDEVARWVTHDGVTRRGEDLVLLDLADVLGEAIVLADDIRSARYRPGGDQTSILRVHRAACMSRRVTDLGRISDGDLRLLRDLVAIDRRIAELEHELVDLLRVRLPNLARALAFVGMIELARLPGWEPNTVGVPHPGLVCSPGSQTPPA